MDKAGCLLTKTAIAPVFYKSMLAPVMSWQYVLGCSVTRPADSLNRDGTRHNLPLDIQLYAVTRRDITWLQGGYASRKPTKEGGVMRVELRMRTAHVTQYDNS